MRDEETVEIGLRAAMTGHLVLSTLHTNDAISSVNRLIDLGAPGFLLASSLHAVLAQRLVRRICKSCIAPQAPSARATAWLTANLGRQALDHDYQKGAGCHHCNNTGYHGRIGVYELLVVTEEIREQIRDKGSATHIKKLARRNGMLHLHEEGLRLVIRGTTSIEELQRVVK